MDIHPPINRPHDSRIPLYFQANFADVLEYTAFASAEKADFCKLAPRNVALPDGPQYTGANPGESVNSTWMRP
jgi:hypothetical protein